MKIIIWTGEAWEKWSPMSAATDGLGGSEIAAINVAEQLASRGHDVEIWGRVVEGTFNGVKYRDSSTSRRPECDVFVSSREINATVGLAPIAKLKVLWMHDLYSGDDYAQNLPNYDVILSVSEWAREQHKRYYSHVPVEKFVATRNGIDPKRFLREGENPANPNRVVKTGCRVIYASSPDRGLSRLLDLWPRIRELIPGAELNVYYGFSNWQAGAERDRNNDLGRIIGYLRHRLQSMYNQGVHYHGRVGQVELANAFMDSSLWIYPTRFLETSCITAMEAQAAGAYPIVTTAGALPETVRCGAFVVAQHDDDAFDSQFLGKIQHFVEDPGWVDGVCLMNRRHALAELSWSGVARQWEKLFVERLGRSPR